MPHTVHGLACKGLQGCTAFETPYPRNSMLNLIKPFLVLLVIYICGIDDPPKAFFCKAHSVLHLHSESHA
jgi:hypothetical protein